MLGTKAQNLGKCFSVHKMVWRWGCCNHLQHACQTSRFLPRQIDLLQELRGQVMALQKRSKSMINPVNVLGKASCFLCAGCQ